MLSFPSWVPLSTMCESSCPYLSGFEKIFNILFRKAQRFSLAGSVPPRTSAGPRLSFLGVPAAGRSHHGPSITGRVGMSEPPAVKPLGLWGPQDLPLWRGVSGVEWDLLPSQGHPSSTAWGLQVPLLCLPKALLCLRHPLASCWGFLVPSPHSGRFPPQQRDLKRLCAGGC